MKSGINNRLPLEDRMGRSAGILIIFISLCFACCPATAEESGIIVNNDSANDADCNPNQAASRHTPAASEGFLFHGTADQRTPMTGGEKLNFYLKSTYGPRSFLYSMAGAGIQQARNSTPEWGQGVEGFSKRFGSSFGQKAIAKSIQFGLGSLLHEDPRCFPSRHSSFVKKALYAVGQEFIVYKDSGGAGFAYTRLAGTTAGVIISRQWHPEADRTVARYIGAIASSIALEAAKNLANEFRPWKKR
jgi:hypothetical protein